jgi:predicted dehydrogenase
MYAPKLSQTETLQTAARHFAECIKTGRTPLTDGEAGSRTVALVEAAQRSLASGGRQQELSF